MLAMPRPFDGAVRRWLACMVACAGMLAMPAAATVEQTASVPADTATDGPRDADERGLWMRMDEAERTLRTSANVIHDPALSGYVRSVLCKLAGPDHCASIRIYIVRLPGFNATMAPNGALQVWTGLLLRTQNEAQLATILGHEYTHFAKRHSLQVWRDLREKTNAAAWFNIIPFGGLVSIGILTSVPAFSRDMEREADEGGLERIVAAGYDAREAPRIWGQLRDEMDATADARHTASRKDKNGGLFATHPPTAERFASLTAAAAAHPGVPGATGAAAWRTAIAPFWPTLIEDQIKLNDFGGTDYLLKTLAGDGWSAPLLNARGDLYRRRAAPGDLEAAAGFYEAAVASDASLAEAWRGLGQVRIKLGKQAEGRDALDRYLALAPNAGDRAMIAFMAGEKAQ